MPRLTALATTVALATSTLLLGCTERPPPPEAGEPADEGPAAEAEPSCDTPEVRALVEAFGERLRAVPLLAPDSVVARTIREHYGPLVTPALLDAWTRAPSTAPGRDVSSPWPDRIEVLALTPAEGTCRVEGEVVYVTSAEVAGGGAAARVPVVLRVEGGPGAWRIGAYESAAPDPEVGAVPDDTSAAAAVEVVRRYYAAIAARDYRAAYALWGDGGAASGQSFEDFAGGFANTAHVEAEVGEPGRVEGAAGSRYVEVPVTVRARTEDGEEQVFEGSLTLRRAVVDGATPEQRRWRLYTADVARVR